MNPDNLNQMLEPEAEKNENSGNALKRIADKLDGTEKLGVGMAGVSVPILAAPSQASKAKEMVPETASVAGQEINIHDITDKVYDFKDEWIIGHETQADSLLQTATFSLDKVGHYSVGYLGAGLGARAVDKATGDYDPKKVALGGMMAVPIYAVAKEGLYEGGSGIQFNLESMDVWGDWLMDTAGALHSVHSYHKKKTASESAENRGRIDKAAREAGRLYGRASNKIDRTAEKFGEKIDDLSGSEKDYASEDQLNDLADDSVSLESVYSSNNDLLGKTPDLGSTYDDLTETAGSKASEFYDKTLSATSKLKELDFSSGNDEELSSKDEGSLKDAYESKGIFGRLKDSLR